MWLFSLHRLLVSFNSLDGFLHDLLFGTFFLDPKRVFGEPLLRRDTPQKLFFAQSCVLVNIYPANHSTDQLLGGHAATLSHEAAQSHHIYEAQEAVVKFVVDGVAEVVLAHEVLLHELAVVREGQLKPYKLEQKLLN